MSITYHDFFEEHVSILNKVNKIGLSKGSEYTENKETALFKLYKPLFEADELFNRVDKGFKPDRSKLVYMWLDGEDTYRSRKINEDFKSNHPIAYIGMGTVTRPFEHWYNDKDKVNQRFRSWLEYQRNNNRTTYLVIYALGLTDAEAKALEADLINQVIKTQDINQGAKAYRSHSCGLVKLFNSKHESSDQTVYTLNGDRRINLGPLN